MFGVFQSEYEIHSNKYNAVFKNYGGALTQEECNEAFSICNYILKVKLHNDYRNIESDINLIGKHLASNLNYQLSAKYHITCFDIDMDLADLKLRSVSLPSGSIDEINIESEKYKEYAEKYLAYELLEIRKEQRGKSIVSSINDIDLRTYFAEYQKAKNGDYEINVKADMLGRGGTLHLSIDYIPKKSSCQKYYGQLLKSS